MADEEKGCFGRTRLECKIAAGGNAPWSYIFNFLDGSFTANKGDGANANGKFEFVTSRNILVIKYQVTGGVSCIAWTTVDRASGKVAGPCECSNGHHTVEGHLH